ncbi:MAG: STAS domain-containing protein [Phycisphaeraceae bacterium]|nr:STAS domain-containing protein [Phycisphaeraceae bacterium]
MVDSLISKIQTLPDGILVQLAGDIDFGKAPDLRVQLMQQLQTNPKRLIVDLSKVSYMDSSGVATLVEALQGSRQAGGKMVLCNLQPKVRGIFEIARLDQVFTIVADQKSAEKA